MSGWKEIREAIREEQIGATGQKALLVEGKSDKAFFDSVVEKHRTGAWQTDWCIGVAGKKSHLIKILEKEPTWVGVVDRDEWTNAQITDEERRLPNLRVLPRFCVESYFIEATDLWRALPPVQKDKIVGGEASLRAQIEPPLAQWVRHGALWRAVNPLWEGLRDRGFKEELLVFEATQKDESIRTKLRDWHTYLDPERVFGDFQSELKAANELPVSDRMHRIVHGKMFFRQHVNMLLNRHLGQAEADERVRLLSTTCPVPDDLTPVWVAMRL